MSGFVFPNKPAFLRCLVRSVIQLVDICLFAKASILKSLTWYKHPVKTNGYKARKKFKNLQLVDLIKYIKNGFINKNMVIEQINLIQ